MAEYPRYGEFDFELTPQMRELLREIAANERARLLRVVPRTEYAELFQRDARVSQGAAGLLAPERKLLTVYREELAYALRRLYLELYMASEAARRLVYFAQTGRRTYRFVGVEAARQDLSDRAARTREAFPSEIETDDVAMLLGTISRRIDSMRAILVASRRLVPHETCEIYLGYQLAREQQRKRALRTLYRVAERTVVKDRVVWALSAAGIIHRDMGDLHRAARACSRSARLAPQDVDVTLSWLGASIQVGDHTQVLAAARQTDELFPGYPSGVDRWVRDRRWEHAKGAWKPSQDSADMHRIHLQRLGSTSARVVDSLFGR